MDDKIYIEHLKLMVDKHQEQSDLCYRRLNILIGFNTALFGIAIIFLSRGVSIIKVEFMWFIILLICLLSAAINFYWKEIIRESIRWIDFWRSKVQLLEHGNLHGEDPSNKVHTFYFYDRLLSRASFIKYELPNNVYLKGSEFTKANNFLKQVWDNDTSHGNKGIGLGLLQFIQCLVYFWLLIGVVSVVCIFTGLDPSVVSAANK